MKDSTPPRKSSSGPFVVFGGGLLSAVLIAIAMSGVTPPALWIGLLATGAMTAVGTAMVLPMRRDWGENRAFAMMGVGALLLLPSVFMVVTHDATFGWGVHLLFLVVAGGLIGAGGEQLKRATGA